MPSATVFAVHTDTFRRIERTALRLAQLTVSGSSKPHVAPPTLSKPDKLSLRHPAPIAPQLLALGVDASSSTRISCAFLLAASQLKDLCESAFQRRIKPEDHSHLLLDRTLPTSVAISLSAIYERALHEWTSFLLQNVTPRVLKLQRRLTHSSKQPKRATFKPPFNQSAVPLLERFFDQNAFPSRLEKYELAVQCHMEYRQIHVWFQNRRRRSRKEGKELKQRLSENSVLQSLETSVVEALLPADVDEDAEQLGAEKGDPLLQTAGDCLHSRAPPHAFPSPWPPLCPYDPFPISPGERRFTTPWPRKSGQSISSGPLIDMDQLERAFSTLSLSGETLCKFSEIGAGHPWQRRPPLCIGFSVLCSRAPHPALVNRCGTLSCSPGGTAALLATANPRIQRPSAPVATEIALQLPERTYQSSLVQFRRPPESTKSASTPPCTASGPRLRRGLPRRIPKNPPLKCHASSSSRPLGQAQIEKTRCWSSTSPVRPSSPDGSGSDTDSLPSTPLFNPTRSFTAELCGVDFGSDGLIPDLAVDPALWFTTQNPSSSVVRIAGVDESLASHTRIATDT